MNENNHFGIRREIKPLEELVGKPVRLNLSPGENEFGIYRGLSGDFHVLNPKVVHNPDGTKGETELSQGIRVDVLRTYEELSQYAYQALLQPHPWKELEGSRVALQTKSGQTYVGILQQVDWNKSILNPSLPTIGNEIITEPIIIDNSDILSPIPVTESWYQEKLNQITNKTQ